MDVIGEKPYRILLMGGKLFATETESGWGLEAGVRVPPKVYPSPFKVDPMEMSSFRRSSDMTTPNRKYPMSTNGTIIESRGLSMQERQSMPEYYYFDGTPKPLMTRRMEYLQKQPQYASYSELQLRQAAQNYNFPPNLQ